MYFGFGYPRILATDLGRDEEWVFLQHDHEHMLGITQTSVQLWSNGLHKLKLSCVARSDENVEQEGRHVGAFWCSAKASIAVLTDKGFLHIYSIHVTKEPLLSGSTAARDLCKADVYLRHTTKLETTDVPLCITGDSKTLLLGCQDGSMVPCTWSGKLRPEVLRPVQEEDWGTGYGEMQPGITSMQHCEKSRTIVLVLSDGSCALLSYPAGSGLSQVNEIEFSHWVCSPQMRATCARIGASAQLIAVGTGLGHLALYRLHRPAVLGSGDSLQPEADTPVRTLSLEPWGHRRGQTGGISQVEWAPDCRAIAVGYERQGLVVWSPSGCRLVCSLRQVPNQFGRDSLTGSVRSTMDELPPSTQASSLQLGALVLPPELDAAGVAQLAWGPQGYCLTAGHVGCCWQLAELQFARSLPHHHRVSHAGPGWLAGSCSTSAAGAGPGGTAQTLVHHGGQQLGEELHVLQAHDRLLVIAESIQASAGGSGVGTGREQARLGNLTSVGSGDVGAQPPSDLVVSHVSLPYQYISANWPVMHAAVSSSGMDMAVAGTHGLALYSRASDRWRLFGDISQERRVSCCALNWMMDGIVLVCSGPRIDGSVRPGSATPAGYELLLFPRYHLDFASLLCRFPLTQPPLAVDCVGRHVLIASEPLEIAVYEVSVRGQLTPLGKPAASLQLVREISMLDVGRPLLDLALVPTSPTLHMDAVEELAQGANGAKPATQLLPRQCVLLRWGGLMSALDLEVGSEVTLSTEVETFWLSDSMPVGPMSAAPSLSNAPSVASGLDGLGLGGSTGSRSGQLQLQLPMAGASNSIINMPGQVAATTKQLPLGHLVTDPRTPAPALAQAASTSSMASGQAGAGEQMSPGGLLADAQPQPAPTLGMAGVEMPWWSYGPQGMQLWFPSSLTQPLLGLPTSPLDRQQQQQDIELEFDQEVYPVGISLADAAIVGVTQRVVRSAALTGRAASTVPGSVAQSLPCFHPVPESQPVLPCLLRRLLQRGAYADALLLARRHEHGPHFSRSLEWLLFTALEMESSKPMAKRLSIGASGRLNESFHLGRTPMGDSRLHRSPSAYGQSGHMVPINVSALLTSAADLVRAFPSLAADVIVAVARKTDAQLWPALFSAVGAPSVLLEGLLEAGALASAACFLLVIDRLEGAAMAHTQALRLMRSALKRGLHPLVGELLRFVIPPGGLETALSGTASELGSPTGRRSTDALSPGSQGSPFASKQVQQGVTEATRAAAGSGVQQQQQSWFGWLFGWGPSPDAGQQAGGPRRASSTGLRRISTSNGGAKEPPRRLESVASDSIAPAADARQMVAEAAWSLLESGRLGALVALSQAVAFLGSGLVGLMLAHPPPSGTVPSRHAPPCAVELLSSLALAVAEFPVWQGERVEADALAALGLVRALGAQAWVVVLSVVLVNLPDVSTFVAAHPQVWAEFVGLVQADKTFTYLHNIIAAATPAPPAPAVLGAVQQQAAAEIQPQESAGAGVPLPVMPGASQTAAS